MVAERPFNTNYEKYTSRFVNMLEIDSYIDVTVFHANFSSGEGYILFLLMTHDVICKPDIPF